MGKIQKKSCNLIKLIKLGSHFYSIALFLLRIDINPLFRPIFKNDE